MLNPSRGAEEKPAGLRPKTVFSCTALNVGKLPLGADRALVSGGYYKWPEKALYVDLC